MSTQGSEDQIKKQQTVLEKLNKKEPDDDRIKEDIKKLRTSSGSYELMQADQEFDYLRSSYDTFIKKYNKHGKDNKTTQEAFRRLIHRYNECMLEHNKNIADVYTQDPVISSFKGILTRKYSYIPQILDVLKEGYKDESELSKQNLSKIDKLEKLIEAEKQKRQFDKLIAELISTEESYNASLNKIINKGNQKILANLKDRTGKEITQEQKDTVNTLLMLIPEIERVSAHLKERFQAFEKAVFFARAGDFEQNIEVVRIAHEIERLFEGAVKYYSTYAQYFESVAPILPFEDAALLIQVIQRGPRYQLLFEQLMKMDLPDAIHKTFAHACTVFKLGVSSVNLAQKEHTLEEIQQELKTLENKKNDIFKNFNDTTVSTYNNYLEQTNKLAEAKKLKPIEKKSESPKKKGVMKNLFGIGKGKKSKKQESKKTLEKTKKNDIKQMEEVLSKIEKANPTFNDIIQLGNQIQILQTKQQNTQEEIEVFEKKIVDIKESIVNLTKDILPLLESEQIPEPVLEAKEEEVLTEALASSLPPTKPLPLLPPSDIDELKKRMKYDTFDITGGAKPDFKQPTLFALPDTIVLSWTDIDKVFADLYKELASGKYDKVCVPTLGKDKSGFLIPSFQGGIELDPSLQERVFERVQELKVFCRAKEFIAIPDKFKQAFRSGLPDKLKDDFDKELAAHGIRKAPPANIDELKKRMNYKTIDITNYNKPEKPDSTTPDFKNKGATLFVLQDNTIDMQLSRDQIDWKNRVGHGGMADAKYMGASKILDSKGNPKEDPYDHSPLYDVYAVGVPTVAKKEKGKSWWEPKPPLTPEDIDKGFANLYREFASGRYDNICVPTWGKDSWGRPLPAFTGGGSADKLPPELQKHMFKRFQELKVFCNTKTFMLIPDEFRKDFRDGLPNDLKAAFDKEVAPPEVKHSQDTKEVSPHFEDLKPPPRPAIEAPQNPSGFPRKSPYHLQKDQNKQQKETKEKDQPSGPPEKKRDKPILG